MDTGFDFTVILTNIVYFFIGRFPHGTLGGIALTLYLAVISCILSFFGGLILGLMSISHNRIIKYCSMALLNIIRGMPLLMVIFWMYFLLPAFMGRTVSESWTVIMALTLFTSAYMSQIVKAGVEGIPKGQTEAGLSTGLPMWQVMVYIVLPQGLRNMIPSFVNQFVSMIKDTSLAFIVGVSELTHVATQINNRTIIYPTEIFFFIAVIYFIICYAFTSLSRWLEKRLAWRR
ncbi:MAG TPA: amino acid ABC transporter permease [Syntrophorhabdaceae bacterium]|jgi:polar amino acid transport system permease protein|nr:amino acid ABC transporter permease [Syntrophorhabdaceae bacterium]MDI9560322.1 amino acid ABC transporter permease [Pseudomonadota bacterium]OQC47813.1 MAG: putative glutamine ABC transporter permease protein GlnP [Deltaproteobacteria bacterium ADurb.Bin026]MBP8699574.1 amino acid ABC transporter permease [Syntrophorhabdaceae bacterium]MBV6504945.1 putative glutamine ABC transporter permease protein GlnP [Syntrophorhabdaceae bacterium]